MRSLLVLLFLAAASVRAPARTDAPPLPPVPDGVEQLSAEQIRAIELAFIELPVDPAAEPAGQAPSPHAHHASLLRFGERKLEEGDYQSAMIAFQQVGRATNLNSEREAALAGMARAYRRSGDFVKAVATYERLIQDHAGTIDTPMYLLELGRTLRALGAPRLAITRFYSVLHAVLKVPPGKGDLYLQIARTAQFEIAETHFQMGNFEEAGRFYSRLNLLDLAPPDRQRAEFKAAQSRARAGNTEAAVAGYRRFIDRHPDVELNAEARFELATLLQQMGRRAESLEVTLELLRREHASASFDKDRWTYWQRRTGNQLANDFYNQGDFASAFAIYSRLADISTDPRWRLPVLYQMGLCQERLLQSAAARDLYQQIRQEAGTLPELAEMQRMATWRLGQLDWSDESRKKLEVLNLPAHVSLPPGM